MNMFQITYIESYFPNILEVNLEILKDHNKIFQYFIY